MVNERVRVELFDQYCKTMEEELSKGNEERALSWLLKAAKLMYELAKASDGYTRKRREAQADRLCDQIPLLNEKIEKKKSTKAERSKTESAKKESGASGEKRLSPEDKILGSGSSEKSSKNDDESPISAMDVPNINFDDVIGLHDVKDAIYSKVINPRKNPALFEKFHIKQGGGVLMYGPPGTGKTMIAQAIAHEVGAKFYALRCSELVSHYFGGTEQNIKKLFDTARQEENAVIFFDEFDALAVKRDRTNSSVMQRVVPELLTQFQGVQNDNKKKGHSLLILAATNTPWMLDSAFLRPGRFDERIYVGLPDFDARKGIFEHNVKGVPQKDLDFDALADRCNGYNCADVAQVVEKVKIIAAKREEREKEPAFLTMEDFEEVLDKYRTSVSKSDIAKMKEWQRENG